MSQLPEDKLFANLEGHQYINLTTFRKSGIPVATPVWFSLGDGKLYVFTAATAGKVKRIRNNSRGLQLAPCTFSGKPLGPSTDAVARILPDGEETAARSALRERYGWKFGLGDFFSRLRGQKRHYIEIAAHAGKLPDLQPFEREEIDRFDCLIGSKAGEKVII